VESLLDVAGDSLVLSIAERWNQTTFMRSLL
jgi:hypothetical protein